MTRTVLRLLLVVCVSLPIGAWRQRGGANNVPPPPFVTAINLSNNNVTTGATNAGTNIGTLMVTMSDSSSYTGTMTLGGTDGAKFVLGNSGHSPAPLNIGASNIGTAGTTTNFNISVTAP